MTEITDLSPTDSSNTSVSGESLDGAIANMGRMDNTLQAILGMFGRWTSSDTIASAGTTDIGSQAETYLTVTGTTTITSFGTIRTGTIRVIRFSGVLTLTHNATSLILPGAANITTVAGDIGIFVSEGAGNWRCLNYQKSSTALRGAGSIINTWKSEYTTYTTTLLNIPFDDTIPQITEGLNIISRSITLSKATNRVRVRAFIYVSSNAVTGIAGAIFEAGVSNAKGASSVTAGGANYTIVLPVEAEWAPGVTSVTVNLNVGAGAGGTTILNGNTLNRLFGGVAATTMVIEEIEV